MPSLELLSLIPITIAAVVGTWRFKELSSPLRGIVIVVFSELFMEGVSRVTGTFLKNNLFTLPIDTVLEFTLLAWVYRQILQPSVVSRWLPVVIGLFIVWGLLSYLRPNSVYEFNTLQRFTESLLVLSLVLLYFYKVIRELVIVQLEREPMLWVSLGLLLYFAGNVFIFISSNYVMQRSSALSLQLWAVHAVIYMVLNLSYALALWIAPSNQK